jgi:putative ABC transport system permease protein
VAGSVSSPDRSFDVTLELADPRSAIWRPTILGGGAFDPGERGVVLAREAAHDLGVGVGDVVTLRHPRRVSERAFSYVDSRVPVLGLHPNPFRFLAYMDVGQADLLGLAGATNLLAATPAPGRSSDDVARALFPLAGIASVQRASVTTDTLRDAMGDFTAVLRVAEAAALALVLLLALNATGITIEERVREHATMLAFGLPVRSIVGSAAVEQALIGLLGTLLGVAIGWGVISWMTGSLLPEVLPEVGVEAFVSVASIASAVAIGVGAMALAPLLTARRLLRLDVPSALRVVE